MIGGKMAIPTLASAYAKVTYVDTSAFMSSVYRQRLVRVDRAKVLKVPELTLTGQTIDDLLAENIATMRSLIEDLISDV